MHPVISIATEPIKMTPLIPMDRSLSEFRMVWATAR